MKIKSLKEQKIDLIHTSSDKAFKGSEGTVIIGHYHFNMEGHLKVPLSPLEKFY